MIILSSLQNQLMHDRSSFDVVVVFVAALGGVQRLNFVGDDFHLFSSCLIRSYVFIILLIVLACGPWQLHGANVLRPLARV